MYLEEKFDTSMLLQSCSNWYDGNAKGLFSIKNPKFSLYTVKTLNKTAIYFVISMQFGDNQMKD